MFRCAKGRLSHDLTSSAVVPLSGLRPTATRLSVSLLQPAAWERGAVGAGVAADAAVARVVVATTPAAA